MVEDFDIQTLVGMDEEIASIVARENNFACRTTSRDGKAYAVTCDFRFDRVNIEVEAFKVTKVSIG